MDYMTAKEAAEKWAITPRRVQVLCAQGKIPGAVRFGVTWAIPKNAARPKDGRVKKNNGNE
ncbi:helix-turn-helix domain-containing protein [Oscillibacter sp.]|uniref:helix-turn-helix domain-containing protein n=1 Tax=Oscillibacter sp. TaxID=1945593 RepID=UPI0028A822FC|nr:helix-turn-helix domain-containing protein [Oscillibacter sp.]